MQDKWFATAKDRYELHRSNIARDLEYLEYFHYDYIKALAPDFSVQIEAVKAALKRMAELVDELETK